MRTTSLLASSLLLVAALGACRSNQEGKAPPAAAEKPTEPAAPPAPAPAPSPAPAPAAAATDTTITSDGVGPIRLGSALASAALPGAKLETRREVGDEGDEEIDSKMLVAGDTILLRLGEDGGTIAFIGVEDPRFKTEKGIGVGSTADELATAYGTPTTPEDMEVLHGETCVEFEAVKQVAFCFEQPEGWKGAVKARTKIGRIAVSRTP